MDSSGGVVFGAATDAGRVEGAAASTVNANPQVTINIQYRFIIRTPSNIQIV